MPAQDIEQRLAALESEVARLKQQLSNSEPKKTWLDQIYGSFANDPIYEKAMKYGRQYRESLRPKKKPKKKRKRKNGDS